MRSRDEVSAGGVVYRISASGLEVLVCKSSGYHRWVLPKGLVDEGETHEQAAVREVREETGVNARLIAALGEPEKYVYSRGGMRIFKRVYYFLMTYESGDIAHHDYEMEDVRWATFEEADQLLAYDGAKSMVRRAQTMIAADKNQFVT
jgi:8-oxo-dGTP pyrophosphatase MutT (NUDIX family)